jgi:hypothetical protein
MHNKKIHVNWQTEILMVIKHSEDVSNSNIDTE